MLLAHSEGSSVGREIWMQGKEEAFNGPNQQYLWEETNINTQNVKHMWKSWKRFDWGVLRDFKLLFSPFDVIFSFRSAKLKVGYFSKLECASTNCHSNRFHRTPQRCFSIVFVCNHALDGFFLLLHSCFVKKWNLKKNTLRLMFIPLPRASSFCIPLRCYSIVCICKHAQESRQIFDCCTYAAWNCITHAS